MRNNAHLQTLIVIAILGFVATILYFIPVVAIFMMLFLLIYAMIYSDIIKQQRENDV
jgi:heme O synthase-like polyprenyltransferase